MVEPFQPQAHVAPHLHLRVVEAGEFVARVDGFVHRPVQPQRRVERVERIVVGLGERADVLLFALA